MTLGFAAFTVAAILIQSAFQNLGFFQFLAGAPSPGPDPAYNILGGGTGGGAVAMASGGTSAPSGGGASVAGHPELKPGISAVVNEVLHMFPGLVITSTTRGVHAKGSYHYLGRAADLAGTKNLMYQAAAWIARTQATRLTEGIHNPNLSVKNGQVVSSSFWGFVTWEEHANHIHLAV